MTDDKKKMWVAGIGAALLIAAMVVDAFKPGGDFFGKVSTLLMAAVGGGGLGAALVKRPGDTKAGQ